MPLFEKGYVANIRGKSTRISADELNEFSRLYSPQGDFNSRISKLFWVDLYILSEEFHIDPPEILREISFLESGISGSETKPAEPYKREPLKGLYHKHFFAANFIIQNLEKVYQSSSFEAEMDKLLSEARSSSDKEKKIHEIANKATFGALQQRASLGKLTGEWIIFAKYEGKNYYLCLNPHNAGDKLIAQRITEFCLGDFPFLPWILNRGIAIKK